LLADVAEVGVRDALRLGGVALAGNLSLNVAKDGLNKWKIDAR
jgi:hypothetical protein